jgi:hypothetical protein
MSEAVDYVNPTSSDFLGIGSVAGDDWNPLDPGEAPPPPDFVGMTEAEAAAAQQLWEDSLAASRYDVNQPEGSLTWSVDDEGKWTQDITLSPEMQSLYDKNIAMSGLTADMGLLANEQISDIFSDPFTLDDFETYDEEFYNSFLDRLEQDIDKDWEDTQAQLIASGHSSGDEGYAYEQEMMNRAKTDASTQAYLAAQDAALRERGQIVEEALLERNQPINEYSAWRTGSQVSTPQFQSQPYIPPPSGPEYLDAANMQAQYDLGIYNADVAGSNAITSGLFDLGAGYLAASDRRLKKDIKRVGETKGGAPLYQFSYLWDDVKHIGTMAQDILDTQPEAVKVMDNGYYAVDYEVLK